jgi:hypothetical protein
MHRWKRLLVERMAELDTPFLEELISGRVNDFSDYRYRVGYLAGLAEMRRLVDEVESIINSGEK